MTARPKPSLLLIGTITALGMSPLHMVVPAVPLMATALGADGSAHVQLVLSLYLAGIAGGQLVYGPLSDRYGRRPVLIAGLVLFLLGTLMCGMAWSLTALIGGRILQGVGACAGIVLGRAIVRDVYDRDAAARGIALLMMAMTLAPAVSPAIGAYLAEWVDWRAIFALLGAAGAIMLALTVFRLAETNLQRTRLDPVGMAFSCAALFRSRQFVGYALCSACASASWFAFCASTPHILVETLQRPPSTYGLMILLPMATYILGNGAAARFTQRLGGARMIIMGRGLGFAAAGALVLWFETYGLGIWTLFIPIALGSIGDGMSQPSVLAAGLSVEPRLAGTASGLIGFLQMTAAATAIYVVAALPYPTAVSTIAAVAGLSGLAFGFGLIGVQSAAASRLSEAPMLQLRREEST